MSRLTERERINIVHRISCLDGPLFEGPRVRNADDLLRQLVEHTDSHGRYFAHPALLRRLFWWQNTKPATIQRWLDELVARGEVRVEPLGINVYSGGSQAILTIQHKQRFPRFAHRDRISDELRQAVYDRDGRMCVHCRSTEALSLDHIHPWSLGGRDDLDNLQTLCKSCNSRKGARI